MTWNHENRTDFLEKRRIGRGALGCAASASAPCWASASFASRPSVPVCHALHLARHRWRNHLTVSYPRLRPADGGFQPLNPVSDRDFVQLICALRLLLPDAGLVMSTCESAQLRDNLPPLGSPR